jgi:hypothetical protein
VLSSRIDNLKKLRALREREPYDWVRAGDLVSGDRVEFLDLWIRVVIIVHADWHIELIGDRDHQPFTIDYHADELVRVQMPRPEGAWTGSTA